MAGSPLEVLRATGLSADLAQTLASLAKPAVRLSAHKVRDEAAVPVGASKLGGLPDVSGAFQWLRWKQQPLSFLAQVNLADVTAFSFCSVLPNEGVLSFFYDADQGTWGFDPKDRGSWLVHYEPSVATLKRTPYPSVESSRAVHAPCSLSVSDVVTLPPAESTLIEKLRLSTEDFDKYYEALERYADESGAAQHQLLGHPSPIQGDMQLECQLASNGIYCGDPSGYQDPRARELELGASQWRLLMQIDSEDAADMMWGDCGRLYFWLTEHALAQKAFQESWMILQCS